MSFSKDIKNTIELELKVLWLDEMKTPIQWENVKFTPPVSSRYIQVFIIPLSTSPATLGVGGGRGEINYEFDLQINLICPADTGTNNAVDLLDELAELFELRVLETDNNCFLNFYRPAIRAPHYVDDNAKYVLPIRCPFFYRRNLY